MSQHRGEGYVCYSRFIGNEQAIQKLKFVMAEEGNIRWNFNRVAQFFSVSFMKKFLHFCTKNELA
jgi:hypothetical protein